MKQTNTFTNLLLLIGILLLLLLAGLPAVKAQNVASDLPVTTSPVTPAATNGCDSSRTVQVSGSALINVTPDRAMIQLGVQSNGATPDEVQLVNAAAIQNVIKSIRDNGVDPKDIATDVYIIQPIYEDYNALSIKGYRINNIVAVTLRDVKKTSILLAGALKAGANQVLNVEFFTSELRKYRDQARDLAMKAAGEKAQALANAAGSEAGCPINISENSWSYYNGWWNGNSQNNWSQNTVQNAAPNPAASSAGANDEPISLGQISVKAEVSVTYGLK